MTNKKPVRTARVIFIGGALSASLAVLLVAGCAPLFWMQWLGAMVLGFGLAWTTVQIQAVALKLVVAAVALAETAALAWLLELGGIAWSPSAALAAGTLATGFGLLYGLSKRGRRKRMIEESFGGRISHGTFQRMLEADAPLPFAGEKREASVVGCQLFNGAELAARLSSSDFVSLSNALSDAASQALMEEGGVLIGNGAEQTRALFGALPADPAHAAQAREAAGVAEERLQAFRQHCLVRWGVEPDCRVSVHSGVMVVGIFGSARLGGFDVVLTGE